MNKNEVIEKLDIKIEELNSFDDHLKGMEYEIWKLDTVVLLKKIFASSLDKAKNFIRISPGLREARNAKRHGSPLIEFKMELLAYLVSVKSEIIEYGLPQTGDTLPEQNGDTALLEKILSRFHSVVLQLKERHSDRDTLNVNDEYDVQDLLHALLKPHFDDVRAEVYTPSDASKSTRMNFLLKSEKTVIAVKMTRPGVDAKEVTDELSIDIKRNENHPECETLICFIYDPENRIENQNGIESDLASDSDDYRIKVIISPKH